LDGGRWSTLGRSERPRAESVNRFDPLCHSLERVRIGVRQAPIVSAGDLIARCVAARFDARDKRRDRPLMTKRRRLARRSVVNVGTDAAGGVARRCNGRGDPAEAPHALALT